MSLQRPCHGAGDDILTEFSIAYLFLFLGLLREIGAWEGSAPLCSLIPGPLEAVMLATSGTPLHVFSDV